MSIHSRASTTPYGLSSRAPKPVVAQRDPVSTDLGYDVGTIWVNNLTNSSFLYMTSTVAGAAQWSMLEVTGGYVSTVNSLSPVAGDIIIAGTAAQIATANAGHTVTLSLTGPYTPATYTAHGVLVGEGAAAVQATAAGTTGQVLIGATGANPAFGALGVNSALTAHGVLLGEGNSAIVATAVGATGQALMGSTGANEGRLGSPSFSGAVTAATGLTATAGGVTATAGNIVATAGNISTTAGSITSATTLTATLGNITATNGNLSLATAGNKLLIAATSSATCSAGTFVLSGAATTVVSNSAVTANSIILLTTQALGTVGGRLYSLRRATQYLARVLR